MEYQFISDQYTKVRAKCSMEHQAFAHWINTEIQGNLAKLATVFALIQQSKLHQYQEYQEIGQEYSLFISQAEVMVKANGLNQTDDSYTTPEMLENGFDFYDEESIAICGLEDFELFLTAYQHFLQDTN